MRSCRLTREDICPPKWNARKVPHCCLSVSNQPAAPLQGGLKAKLTELLDEDPTVAVSTAPAQAAKMEVCNMTGRGDLFIDRSRLGIV